ncbi:hypothetical protein FPL06_15875 [Xanthomonas citri pv. glycines]|uniref:MuF-C-terminal domain-containing protein n=1 Tax=Xanthomonas citri TaxID=346 RepID=UPI001184D7C3|nr:hypothetical protein [Xanthomonas citri]TSK01620.1 hypothetical protein FPL06_15875 [Xanthomonas citri pv. glycines]
MTEDLRKKSFKDQVLYYLENGNGRGPALWAGRTPACLRMLGFPDISLRMNQGVLRKIATGKGGERPGLPPASICKLPELIDEPVAIFESATVTGALVVLTSAADSDGNGNLVVSVQANLVDANSRVNMITSAYSKQRSNWVGEQVAAGRARYADEKKSPGILEISGPTLNRRTEPGSQSSTLQKVLLPEDLDKFRAEQRAKAFSKD